MPSSSPATEQRLLGEFAHDCYAKALLLLEMAPYHEEQDERGAMLSTAAELLVKAEADEKAFANACSDSHEIGRASCRERV